MMVRSLKMMSLGIIVISFAVNASADIIIRQANTAKYIKSSNVNGVVQFAKCTSVSGSDCEALGNPNGYSLAALKHEIKRQRVGKVVMVVTTLAVEGGAGTLMVAAAPLAAMAGPVGIAIGVGMG